MVQKMLCRLLLTTAMKNREVARRCNVAANTARRYRERLKEERLLTWEQVSELSDAALDERLNNGRDRIKKQFIEPEWSHIHAEMHRVGVTITLLHEEYAGGIESGVLSEREFRRRYERYKRSLGLVMRQALRPGQELFVDYSGKRPSITDPATGVQTPVELWVGVLGSSRKTFAYCTLTQQLPDWIEAHSRSLAFFGARPEYLVPDNLKSAVVKISRKDGHYINPTYQAFADHHDMLVMPARARKPKDKAPVENGVRLAQIWILARLRNRTFFSLHELNQAIAALLDRLNSKPIRSRGHKSRNELFEEIDRPAMRPLRVQPFEYADWKIGVTVPQDYHLLVDRNYYSVPYTLVGRKVNLRTTVSTVQMFHRDQLVATHERSRGVDGVFTRTEHQPPAHRLYGEEQLAELVAWAETAGRAVDEFIRQHLQLNSAAASMQAFRGLKRLARDFGAERLDRACARALRMKATSITSVRSMLARNIENSPLQDEAANDPIAPHANVRGAGNYE
ncbi:MAG: IS21 family transposase [Chiayiivirga sp.]|jgi:transposase|nr:IS21 family transposase [Chiayiivirga sp.]